MLRYPVISLLTMLAAIGAACGGPTPAPIPTAPELALAPTATPISPPTPTQTPTPTIIPIPTATPTPTPEPTPNPPTLTRRGRAELILAEGKALLQRNAIDEALVKFSEALSQDPNFADAYYHRGLAQYQSGRLQSAVEDLTEAILRNSEVTDFWFSRGLAQFDLGTYEQAAGDFTEAIRLSPRVPEFYFHRGRAYAYSRAWQYDPDLGRQNTERAIEDYTAAIHLDPRVKKYFIERGGLYDFLDFDLKAIDDFSSAIQLDPVDYVPYQERGDTYRFMSEESGKTLFGELVDDRILRLGWALQDYSSAIRLAPNMGKLFFKRGLIYRDMGHDELAIEDYDQAERLGVTEPSLYNNRGAAYLFLGDNEKANASFETAKRLGSTQQNINFLIENIRRSRQPPSLTAHYIGLIHYAGGASYPIEIDLVQSGTTLTGSLDEHNALDDREGPGSGALSGTVNGDAIKFNVTFSIRQFGDMSDTFVYYTTEFLGWVTTVGSRRNLAGQIVVDTGVTGTWEAFRQ